MKLVEDISADPASRIEGIYRLTSLYPPDQAGISEGGRTGMRLSLGDATGTMWGDSPDPDPLFLFAVSAGDPVYVTGTVAGSDGRRPVLELQWLEPLLGDEAWEMSISPAAVLPRPACPDVASLDRLLDLLPQIRHPDLRAFLTSAFLPSRIAFGFLRLPLTGSDVFGYPGGLLRHSVTTASYVAGLEALQGAIREVAIVAALVHDLGHVLEQDVGTGPASHTGMSSLTVEVLRKPLQLLSGRNPELATGLEYILEGPPDPELRGRYPYQLAAEAVHAADALSMCCEGHRRIANLHAA